MKFGIKFIHFASTKVNEMKPRVILCSKRNFFLLAKLAIHIDEIFNNIADWQTF
jgi:hypothetical protein